eukprot:1389709-Amorphochlora_amoeboformis.AAC.1
MAACRRLGIGRTVRMVAISMSLVMLVTRYIDRQPKRILSGQLVRCKDGDADGASQLDCKRLRGGFFQLEYDDDYKVIDLFIPKYFPRQMKLDLLSSRSSRLTED